MANEFLNDADERRLWWSERLLPMVLAIVVPAGLFLFLWGRVSEEKERKELVDRLNRLSGSYSVTIDSVEVTSPSPVVDALKRVADTPAHHSSPIEPHFIRIKSDDEVIEVCLERDSERPEEYWVSRPRKGTCGHTSFGNPCFGGLTTDRLASYWASSRR